MDTYALTKAQYQTLRALVHRLQTTSERVRGKYTPPPPQQLADWSRELADVLDEIAGAAVFEKMVAEKRFDGKKWFETIGRKDA